MIIKPYIFFCLSTIGLALMAFSCKPPNEPQELCTDTRSDTVKAIVQMNVNGALWQAITPPVKFLMDSYRSPPVVAWDNIGGTGGGATAYHNPSTANNYFTLIGTWAGNVAEIPYYTSPDNIYLGKLYSWDYDRLEIMFVAPPTIKAPFTLDSLRSFSFTQARKKHQVYIDRGQYSFLAKDSAVFTSLYFAGPASARYDSLSEIGLVRASLILDEYDATRCRASGRFSFEFMNKSTKKRYVFSDGKFSNVWMKRSRYY